jgi:hypothetical protein
MWDSTLILLAHRAQHICSLVARVAKAQRINEEGDKQAGGKRQRESGGNGDDGDGGDGGAGEEVEMTRQCIRFLSSCVQKKLNCSDDDMDTSVDNGCNSDGDSGGKIGGDSDGNSDGDNEDVLATLPKRVITALAAMLAAPCVQALFDAKHFTDSETRNINVPLAPAAATPASIATGASIVATEDVKVDGEKASKSSHVALDRAFRAIAAVAHLV